MKWGVGINWPTIINRPTNPSCLLNNSVFQIKAEALKSTVYMMMHQSFLRRDSIHKFPILAYFKSSLTRSAPTRSRLQTAVHTERLTQCLIRTAALMLLMKCDMWVTAITWGIYCAHRKK
jgi:hypothetical protein